MTTTPEQALKRIARRAKDLRDVAANYARIEQFDRALDRDIEADAIDWALSRIAELEAQLAAVRRDLSDARSGWEDAVDEVREMEAREQRSECPTAGQRAAGWLFTYDATGKYEFMRKDSDTPDRQSAEEQVRRDWDECAALVYEVDCTATKAIKRQPVAVDAVYDLESFDFWLSRASVAELRCAVALQRHEIDRLRAEPMHAAADTLRTMAEQHRTKNTCNGHWCASNAGEANRLLWVALLQTADAMESKHESA